MRAFSSPSRLPVGGGMRFTRSSSRSSMPIPVLALTMTASCGRQVNLVEDRYDLEPLIDGGITVRDGLGLHTLGGIDDQERPLAGRQ